jgi:ADP-ribosyl-[dinitrogen reductase] hydrolase
MPSRSERIEGGLIGLLIGDALGVPYEFYPAEEIPAVELIELEPPQAFRAAHWGVPPGTWSDDGAHALCLLASLLECRDLDLDDLGRRLLNWYLKGYMAVDAKVFDIGNQTVRALAALQSGVPASEAGPAEERSNGNGSLMRVLPLALWHHGSDERLVDLACRQSLVSHGHLRSQACCALYCLWARYTLNEADDPWNEAARRLRQIQRSNPPFLQELDEVIRPEDHPVGRGGGYVVDCLWSAHQAVQTGPYEQAVKAAIAIGEDTDTTAAVAGGIAGLRDGVRSIPERWRLGLRGRDLYEPLLKALLLRVGP